MSFRRGNSTGTDLAVTTAMMDTPFRPPTKDQVLRVMRLVSGLSRDATDARELMEVMGLIEMKEKPLETSASNPVTSDNR